MNAPGGTNEHIIRAARAFSNRAIANQDIDAISSLWMEDVLVLTSTSVQLLGAEANRRYYQAQFTRRPDTLWVRTPSSVGAPSSWRIAHEEGDWTGQWSESDGRVQLRGRYMAQWVCTEGDWRIQGEIYVPTSRVFDQGVVHV
ncbi:nuclear transport factor 2 family protein [Acidovorax sp. SUPP2539]|uniref:YybH family protein n=1 Tax=Acidovorax sp. SUPP2539 TaxID=2920878 RepID=UPI0023DE3B02|nr:nuclear transport factor 2 family protein [Acidovorax sp. SUPP2539]GKS90291.1 nuclear transport factor 2 family protein [Acidovorax sp. SUPP2539]